MEKKFKIFNKISKEFLNNEGLDFWQLLAYFAMYKIELRELETEQVQYTGLKNGSEKEIYEGDLVEFTVFDMNDNDTQYKGCIVYSGSRFMIWNKPDDEFYGSNGGFDLDWVVSQDDELKIIGNKFENPLYNSK